MLRVRELGSEERETITRWAQSRTEPARRVERARIIARSTAGANVPMIARELRLEAGTVRLWLKRFNAAGLAGLADRPRGGRPPTYTREQVGEVIVTALTAPQSLGLPFASWTLDRLQAYLNDAKGIPIKRNRIDELLIAEGLRWRTQETWFGKRVDPDFAAKRGLSKPSTPLPPSGV
jgi:transposase